MCALKQLEQCLGQQQLRCNHASLLAFVERLQAAVGSSALSSPLATLLLTGAHEVMGSGLSGVQIHDDRLPTEASGSSKVPGPALQSQGSHSVFVVQGNGFVRVDLRCRDSSDSPVAVCLTVSKPPSSSQQQSSKTTPHCEEPISETVRGVCAELLEAVVRRDETQCQGIIDVAESLEEHKVTQGDLSSTWKRARQTLQYMARTGACIYEVDRIMPIP